MHCRLYASLFEDSKAYSADESLQMFVLRWTEICRDLQKKNLFVFGANISTSTQNIFYFTNLTIKKHT